MSWNVGDDEWLAEPAAVPGSGPLDRFDEQVMGALAEAPVLAASQPPVQGLPQGVPPPPHSAAFDADVESPPYEVASFVTGSSAPVDASPSNELAVELIPPATTSDPRDNQPEPDPEPAFHIPTLSLGAVARAAPSAGADVVARQPPSDEPASGVEETFVIPPLSVSSDPVMELDEGVEEVAADELEEVEDAPIRTGDTVIARAPQLDESPPQPVAEAPVTLATSVYDDDDDDDDDGAGVVSESVERVDSGELEIVDHEEPTQDAEFVGGSAEMLGFVIPTLARSEPSPAEGEAVQSEAAQVDSGGLVIPTLTVTSPAEDESLAEVDDLQEVDAEAIESLDDVELEELEQPEQPRAAPEPTEIAEPKPPAPPEAKQPPGKRRKGWYDDVFAEHFLFLYPLTWEETGVRDAGFIHALLGAREGMTILDVGCGDGRHAVELAKLGARVLGVDNSLALLLAAAQNKEAAELADGQVDFIHGDMRRLPRDREFDAVICVGTTLGYFEEEQNWLCLQEMYDRLAPGGRMLVHVFNRDFVAPHLPSRSWWQGKRCMVIDEAEMNFFANRLRVHRTVIFDDGRQYEHHMFMRAYTVQDLGKAISQLGMRVIEVSGSRDTRGRFYGSASPDIWIVAEKK
jgi:SAM-dependent methyltransferase